MLGLTPELKTIIDAYRLRTENELGDLEIVQVPLGVPDAVHVNLTDKRGEIEPERLFTLIYPGIDTNNAHWVLRPLITAVLEYIFDPVFATYKDEPGDKPEVKPLITLYNGVIKDLTEWTHTVNAEYRALAERMLSDYDHFLNGQAVNPDYSRFNVGLLTSAAAYRASRDAAYQIERQIQASRRIPDLEWVKRLGASYASRALSVHIAWNLAIDDHPAIKRVACIPNSSDYTMVRQAFDAAHSEAKKPNAG